MSMIFQNTIRDEKLFKQVPSFFKTFIIKSSDYEKHTNKIENLYA
jgi:hypothetical protein